MLKDVFSFFFVAGLAASLKLALQSALPPTVLGSLREVTAAATDDPPPGRALTKTRSLQFRERVSVLARRLSKKEASEASDDSSVLVGLSSFAADRRSWSLRFILAAMT